MWSFLGVFLRVSESLWVMSLCEGLWRGLCALLCACLERAGFTSGDLYVDAGVSLPGRKLIMSLWIYPRACTDISHYCLPLGGFLQMSMDICEDV